jgi:integrase
LQQNGENVLRHFGKTTLLSTLTSDRIDSFAQAMKEDGLAGATINRQLSALSKMLQVGVDKGRLKSRPKIERKRESPGRRRVISETEEAKIIHTFQQWGLEEQSAVVQVLADTGLRPSELWRLTANDINFSSNLIHVWESKTDVPRSVPMTERVQSIMRKRQAIKSAVLFPYDNHWMRGPWERVKRHLGLSDDNEFVVYAFRHTCASRLVQRGIHLLYVQEWLGHSSNTMTKRYAHLCPRNLQEAVKVLEPKRGDVAPIVAGMLPKE